VETDITTPVGAFSCLLQVFGLNPNALVLDQIIRENWEDIWNTPHAYDERISLNRSVTGTTWPDTNDAIVRFRYRSPSQPTIDTNEGTVENIVTLYCKVADWQQGTILDPTDGTVKPYTTYGQPEAWADYTSRITTKTPMVYVENTVDGIDYKRLPQAPQKMYVTKPQGTDLTDFSGDVKNFRDFILVPNSHAPFGAMVRIMGTAHHPVIPTGKDFYVTIDDWGNFTGTGHVEQLRGYPVGDLGLTRPAPLVKKLTDVKPPAPKTPPPPPKLNPEDLGFSWLRDDHQPVMYQVMLRCWARDYVKNGISRELYKGTTIAAYGTFRAYDRLLLLLRVENAGVFDYWYGIPEVSRDGDRVAEELPDLTELKEATPLPRPRQYNRFDQLFHRASNFELFIKHDIFKVKR
jgi:hypothetical protein